MDFLHKLEHVRQTGTNRWLARCPAHEDNSPSLAIRLTDDGRWLLHCFTGCDVNEIVSAVGLELTDLFPPTDRHHRPREGRPFSAMDVLRAVSHEVQVAALACSDVVAGRPLSESDLQRVQLAHDRLQNAVNIAEGR
ncbi:MAG: DNA primase [Gammaproteobacteria bacterium]